MHRLSQHHGLRVFLASLLSFGFSMGSWAQDRAPLNLDFDPLYETNWARPHPQVLIFFGDAKDFPKSTQDLFVPGANLNRPKDGAIEVISMYENDNFFLGGLEAALRGLGMSREDAAKVDGDDFGYTHGSHLTIGQARGGKYYAIVLVSDLYTQKTSNGPENQKRQFFTIHDLVGAYVEFPGEKLSMSLSGWDFLIGSGFESVNSENPNGFFDSTSQQDHFHEFADQLTGYDTHRENIPSGLENQQSLFLDLKLNLLKTLAVNGVRRVSLTGGGGFHFSGIEGASYVEAKVGLRRYTQLSPTQKANMVGVEFSAREYEDGATKMVGSLFFRRGHKRGFWEIRLDHPFEDEEVDFLNYDGDGETIMQIRFGRRFGRTR